MGGGRRITSFRTGIASSKRHLSYPHPEGRTSHKPQTVQTHSPVQRDLQNHHEGHSQPTQTHSAFRHLKGASRICRRETNHG
jgi:hypothetical protein